ncbi:MAG: SPOR domain-containing protein [Magnetococcales bacterium]|nr:SPOR domain-containing protein [Magnetococcales bacterium]
MQLKSLVSVFSTYFLLIGLAICLAMVPSVVDASDSDKNVYTVQVSASRSREDAIAEMEKLRRQGFTPFMLDIYNSKNILWHTVQIGYDTNLQVAKKQARKFRKKSGKSAEVLTLPATSFAYFKLRASGESFEGTQKLWTNQPSPAIEEPPKNLSGTYSQQPSVSLKDIKPDVSDPVTDGKKLKSMEPDVPDSLDVASPLTNDKKWYVVASVGVSHVGKSSEDLDRDLSSQGFTTTSSIDRTNQGLKLIGGYKFARYLGVEAGFVHFTKVNTKIDASNAGGIANAVVNHAPLTMNGAVMSGVGTWRITPEIALHGKAGGFLWNGKVNANALGDSVTRKDDGIDPILGVGAEFNISDQTLFRIEWDRYLTSDKMDLFSSGVGVRF